MSYQSERIKRYRQLGQEEDYQDVMMSVLAAIVLEQPIREEDRRFLVEYLKIKQDIPKVDDAIRNVAFEVPRD